MQRQAFYARDTAINLLGISSLYRGSKSGYVGHTNTSSENLEVPDPRRSSTSTDDACYRTQVPHAHSPLLSEGPGCRFAGPPRVDVPACVRRIAFFIGHCCPANARILWPRKFTSVCKKNVYITTRASANNIDWTPSMDTIPSVNAIPPDVFERSTHQESSGCN